MNVIIVKAKLFSMLLGITLVAANPTLSSDINRLSDFLANQISSVAGSGTVDQQEPTDRSYKPMDVWVFSTLNISYYNLEYDEFVRRSEKAKYGEGKILNVMGKLVHVTSISNENDHTGCDEDMLGTNGNPLPNEPWIALIKRGKCDYEEKVKHAWNHNASGVIVYNDIESINLEKMKIEGKERHITSVFTYKWVGEDFAKLVEEKKDVTVSINEGMRGGQEISNNKKINIVTLSCLFLLCLCVRN